MRRGCLKLATCSETRNIRYLDAMGEQRRGIPVLESSRNNFSSSSIHPPTFNFYPYICSIAPLSLLIAVISITPYQSSNTDDTYIYGLRLLGKNAGFIVLAIPHLLATTHPSSPVLSLMVGISQARYKYCLYPLNLRTPSTLTLNLLLALSSVRTVASSWTYFEAPAAPNSECHPPSLRFIGSSTPPSQAVPLPEQ